METEQMSNLAALHLPLSRNGGDLEKGKQREDIQSITPESSPDPAKFSDSDTSDENVSAFQPVPDAEADQAEGVLGISIGRAQSRMKARQTPAEEKTRAIENSGGYFHAIPDSQDEEQQPLQLTEEPEAIDEPLPPAAAQTNENKKVNKSVSKPNSRYSLHILKSSFSGRRRALSGDSNYSLKFKRLFPDFSLTPSRQGFSPTKPDYADDAPSSSASTPRRAATDIEGGGRPESQSINTGSNSRSTIPTSDDGLAALGAIQNSGSHSYNRYLATKKRPQLAIRHSVSDESLYLRSLSRTSTLEHRPHYENIHSIVNSRYKAIKDSIQDSSSRIFSMPSFNLPDFRHEWHPSRFLGEYQRKDDGNESNDGNIAVEINGSADASASNSTNFNSAARQNSIYPLLDDVGSKLTGDVVVMGGYRGSILRSAKPPHRQLWVPMKVGLNIRKVDLEVGLTHDDEERMEESIIAREVLSHIGPVDICRRLLQRLRKFQKLRNNAIRVWEYGYDWRLSPHLLAKRLINYLEALPCNAPDVPSEKRGAYVIAHSLGGLITRHAVNQRPDLFAGVVYAGTPQHCVNILGPLRNGDEVLLSSKVLTAQVNFTIRTSYALLPDDGRCFINRDTKEDILVDFFDVKSWDQYALSPCVKTALPPSGSETKKGLIDLPKIGLSKRLTVKLGGNKFRDAPHSPSSPVSPQALRTAREKSQAEAIPNDSEYDRKVVPISGGPVSGPAPLMGSSVVSGVVGPNTVKAQSSTSNITSQIAANTCTIPHDAAMEYLDRTLKEVRQFRQELAHNESHQSQNRYPPFAVMYSKALPTVYGARVASREDIKRTDAYDDLAFAAGDGVCLASAAMLPPGYRVIKHGLIKSDRGHVGLLGDLEGTAQCLIALVKGREAGVGLGAYTSTDAHCK